MDIISIVKIAVLCISIILIVASCIGLYRRFSPAIQTNARSDNEYNRYTQYCYTVEGIPYCKSYFHEDNEAKLPTKTRIYYNRKNPKMMYREGALRDGVIVSVASIILGALLLFALVASYIC